jgi:hypothetical protein
VPLGRSLSVSPASTQLVMVRLAQLRGSLTVGKVTSCPSIAGFARSRGAMLSRTAATSSLGHGKSGCETSCGLPTRGVRRGDGDA